MNVVTLLFESIIFAVFRFTVLTNFPWGPRGPDGPAGPGGPGGPIGPCTLTTFPSPVSVNSVNGPWDAGRP